MPETAFIYALCEPHNENIRYIGKSVNPEKRLREHWAHSRKTRTRLGAWLRTLERRPVLRVICRVSEELWATQEREQIAMARLLGFDLVNGTDGGDGGPVLRGSAHPQFGKSPSSQTIEKRREKMIGRKLPPFSVAHRKHLSEAMTGRKRGPYSPEHRRKIGLAQRGVPKGPLSIRTRARMASAQRLRRLREKGSR